MCTRQRKAAVRHRMRAVSGYTIRSGQRAGGTTFRDAINIPAGAPIGIGPFRTAGVPRDLAIEVPGENNSTGMAGTWSVMKNTSTKRHALVLMYWFTYASSNRSKVNKNKQQIPTGRPIKKTPCSLSPCIVIPQREWQPLSQKRLAVNFTGLLPLRPTLLADLDWNDKASRSLAWRWQDRQNHVLRWAGETIELERLRRGVPRLSDMVGLVSASGQYFFLRNMDFAGKPDSFATSVAVQSRVWNNSRDSTPKSNGKKAGCVIEVRNKLEIGSNKQSNKPMEELRIDCLHQTEEEKSYGKISSGWIFFFSDAGYGRIMWNYYTRFSHFGENCRMNTIAVGNPAVNQGEYRDFRIFSDPCHFNKVNFITKSLSLAAKSLRGLFVFVGRILNKRIMKTMNEGAHHRTGNGGQRQVSGWSLGRSICKAGATVVLVDINEPNRTSREVGFRRV